MNAFWALVKNDLKIGRRSPAKNLKWFRIYLFAAILLVFIQYTIAMIYGNMIELKPTRGLWALLALYFLIMSMNLINAEWRGYTAGWWLALPYSRQFLLATKFTAAFIRSLLGILTLTAISALLYLDAFILRPEFFASGEISINLLVKTAQIVGFILLLSPVIIIFGITAGVLQHSKWKPAAPLLWILFPMITYSYLAQGLFQNFIDNSNPWSARMVIGESLSIIVLAVLANYLLENQVEI